jgi:hypothetical protein
MSSQEFVWGTLIHLANCTLFDNAMVIAGYVWADYKKQLKKGEQWNVEVY